jgi:hypothetical protein
MKKLKLEITPALKMRYELFIKPRLDKKTIKQIESLAKIIKKELNINEPTK